MPSIPPITAHNSSSANDGDNNNDNNNNNNNNDNKDCATTTDDIEAYVLPIDVDGDDEEDAEEHMSLQT